MSSAGGMWKRGVWGGTATEVWTEPPVLGEEGKERVGGRGVPWEVAQETSFVYALDMALR
jgi:hypothetical protein